MLRWTAPVLLLHAINAGAQAGLGFGGGAQYDLVHFQETQRGMTRRPWLPPDLTGWGGHFGGFFRSGGEIAVRVGVVYQWQHVHGDYAFLIEQGTGSAVAGYYTGTYDEHLTMWKIPLMASVRLSDRARFELGVEPFFLNTGRWVDQGTYDSANGSPPIPYEVEGTDDDTFKEQGWGLTAGLFCGLGKSWAYSISYWRDLGGYLEGTTEVVGHHNMFQLTLWVVLADQEEPMPDKAGSW